MKINKTDFKHKLVEALGVGDLPEQDQDIILAKVELLANTRLATALPELLDDKTYEQVEAMQAKGQAEDDILDWVEKQIPHYEEMMQAMMLDIADEMTEKLN
ncbi:hypothetical protein IPL85_02220 [Candidatus Saccharibacteria bacterium]|nr:MAG: hypothetical protein IPL85_02220 [Candidatus Saccharibacteria bacterium]